MQAQTTQNPKAQRLDKFLAKAAHLTRSQAKKVVHSGEVKVNGQVVKDAGLQIAWQDQVTWLDQQLDLIGKRYVMLHKPLGYECSSKSSHYPLVTDLLTGLPNKESLNPVGRLDVNTSGLLLLTDDGPWLHRVIAPKYRRKKVYLARLAEPLIASAAADLAQGLLLQGEEQPTLPAQLEVLSATQVKLTVVEGRYHQVRRMFAALGNHVEELHREALDGLVLDTEQLQPGQWRHLTAQEVASLGS